jgi:hypothetical protein
MMVNQQLQLQLHQQWSFGNRPRHQE